MQVYRGEISYLVKSNDRDKGSSNFLAKPSQFLFVDTSSPALNNSVSIFNSLRYGNSPGHFTRPDKTCRTGVLFVNGLKVLNTFVGSIMFSTNFWVIPFDSQPEALCWGYLTHEPDCTPLAVFDVLYPVTDRKARFLMLYSHGTTIFVRKFRLCCLKSSNFQNFL